MDANFEGENPFEILGISPNSDERERKRAYARLIKQYRPEKFPAKFQKIREAYEELKSGYWDDDDFYDEEDGLEENEPEQTLDEILATDLSDDDYKTYQVSDPAEPLEIIRKSSGDFNELPSDDLQNKHNEDWENDEKYDPYENLKKLFKAINIPEIKYAHIDEECVELYQLCSHNDLTYGNLKNYQDQKTIAKILGMRWKGFLLGRNLNQILNEIEEIIQEKHSINLYLCRSISQILLALLYFFREEVPTLFKELMKKKETNEYSNWAEKEFHNILQLMQEGKTHLKQFLPPVFNRFVFFSRILPKPIAYSQLFLPFNRFFKEEPIQYLQARKIFDRQLSISLLDDALKDMEDYKNCLDIKHDSCTFRATANNTNRNYDPYEDLKKLFGELQIPKEKFTHIYEECTELYQLCSSDELTYSNLKNYPDQEVLFEALVLRWKGYLLEEKEEVALVEIEEVIIENHWIDIEIADAVYSILLALLYNHREKAEALFKLAQEKKASDFEHWSEENFYNTLHTLKKKPKPQKELPSCIMRFIFYSPHFPESVAYNLLYLVCPEKPFKALWYGVKFNVRLVQDCKNL